ncbi:MULTISPECIES: MarR family winged helix-turn-helix transcriptional regulator [Mycobacteroides]|uniref:MarR family winged helix-turn-helix transcriptional regulator n=1 Tax=Mycobacteroides TaxID=670516 RepID=UPI0009BEB25A|nr:MarR family transcriptional regulator [[Mycobacterium] chelonae subsp. gwanakae]TDZ97088.1 DNA-binding transcriptional repressor MarR [Mycobacteroides salmoniphilum]
MMWIMSSARNSTRTRRVSEAQIDVVMEASRALVGIAAASVAEVDDHVTLPQLRVLIMIATKGTLNIAAIASGLKVNPSNASRTCDRLVRAGLLDRQESPADRRNSTLTLTARGHKIVQAITDRRREVIEQTLRKIPPAHRDEVVAAFDHFTRAVGESAEHLELTVLWPGNR